MKKTKSYLLLLFSAFSLTAIATSPAPVTSPRAGFVDPVSENIRLNFLEYLCAALLKDPDAESFKTKINREPFWHLKKELEDIDYREEEKAVAESVMEFNFSHARCTQLLADRESVYDKLQVSEGAEDLAQTVFESLKGAAFTDFVELVSAWYLQAPFYFLPQKPQVIMGPIEIFMSKLQSLLANEISLRERVLLRAGKTAMEEGFETADWILGVSAAIMGLRAIPGSIAANLNKNYGNQTRKRGFIAKRLTWFYKPLPYRKSFFKRLLFGGKKVPPIQPRPFNPDVLLLKNGSGAAGGYYNRVDFYERVSLAMRHTSLLTGAAGLAVMGKVGYDTLNAEYRQDPMAVMARKSTGVMDNYFLGLETLGSAIEQSMAVVNNGGFGVLDQLALEKFYWIWKKNIYDIDKGLRFVKDILPTASKYGAFLAKGANYKEDNAIKAKMVVKMRIQSAEILRHLESAFYAKGLRPRVYDGAPEIPALTPAVIVSPTENPSKALNKWAADFAHIPYWGDLAVSIAQAIEAGTNADAIAKTKSPLPAGGAALNAPIAKVPAVTPMTSPEVVAQLNAPRIKMVEESIATIEKNIEFNTVLAADEKEANAKASLEEEIAKDRAEIANRKAILVRLSQGEILEVENLINHKTEATNVGKAAEKSKLMLLGESMVANVKLVAQSIKNNLEDFEQQCSQQECEAFSKEHDFQLRVEKGYPIKGWPGMKWTDPTLESYREETK